MGFSSKICLKHDDRPNAKVTPLIFHFDLTLRDLQIWACPWEESDSENESKTETETGLTYRSATGQERRVQPESTAAASCTGKRVLPHLPSQSPNQGEIGSPVCFWHRNKM